MAALKQGAKELLSSTTTANIQLKGMKLRQEFCCPITYDLMRDPVVLADGHTYERAAIERWIRSNPSENGFIISPLNGYRIEQTILSNLTMKKLIQDLIKEGGAGLYTTDTCDGDRLFDVRPERILVFTCLGPPESEWNEQKFHVASSGCVGGRFVGPEHAVGRDIISFEKDRTVSRVHFEVIKASADVFSMRDLGSAGGTYFRVAFGKRQALQPGVMFLIGKHHFMVSSIDDTATQNSVDMGDSSSNSAGVRGSSDDECREELDELITDAEQLLTVLDGVRNKRSHNGDKSDNDTLIDERERQKIEHRVAEIHERMARLKFQGSQGKRCTLTCFLPDYSAFQGVSMMVDTRGATIGRKATNTICICAENPVDGKISTVDTAISSEHACIEYDERDQTFYLMDGSRGTNGNARRPSTNGTWYRLSGPHQQSAYHDLSVGLEVLIGTLRFGIGESMTISESNVEQRNTSSIVAAAQSKDEAIAVSQCSSSSK